MAERGTSRSRGTSTRRSGSSGSNRARSSTRSTGRAGGSRTPTSSPRPAPRPGTSSARGSSQPRRVRDGARFTGRAAVLLVVVAVLVLSYASSLRAYLQQRDEIRALQALKAEHQAAIAKLEREKNRWKDPAYVQAQARERLLFVMPGEVGFQVIDSDGKPLDPVDTLATPPTDTGDGPQEWWKSAWQSVVIAGQPSDTVLDGAN